MVKRRYRPGYHMEVSKRVERNVVVAEKESTPKNISNVERSSQTISDTSTKSPITIIEKVEEINHIPLNKKNPLDDSCDVVYMVTGERINAIVIEIGDDYVHYKKCDDIKGRLYTVKTK